MINIRYKKTVILLFVIISVIISFISELKSAYSFTAGSPDACTGSPSDNNTCSQSNCHSSDAVFKAGLITANIPDSGYVAENIYSISVTAPGTPESKSFGFQISPQNIEGKCLGKIVITNPAETKLSGKGKYLNQKGTGVQGIGTKTWFFDWIAPEKGTGKVVFYTCVLIGGKTELIYTSNLEINELKSHN